MARVYVGVDFGTTTNVAAAVINGKLKILQPGSPAVAAKAADGTWICGQDAVLRMNELPYCTEVKRFITSGVLTDIATPNFVKSKEVLQKTSGGKVVIGGGDGSVFLRMCGEKLLPQDILKHIARAFTTTFMSVEMLAVDTCCVCVTYPAHFNLRQKFITRNIAVEGAGLGDAAELQLVDEASAAVAGAMRMGMLAGFDNGLVLVLDIGGGTFDVSLLDVSRTPAYTVLRVLDLGGCATTAGKDFKDVLRGMLQQHTAGEDVLDEALSALSTAESTDIVCDDGHTITVDRASFVAQSAPLVGQLLQAARDVLANPSKKKKLANVLLCGGASRIPMIRAMAQTVADDEGCALEVVPDESAAHLVAMGAAVIAESTYDGSATHKHKLVSSSMRPFCVRLDGQYILQGDASDDVWQQELGILNAAHTNSATYHRAMTLIDTLMRDHPTRVIPKDKCNKDQKQEGFLYDMHVLLPLGSVIGDSKYYEDSYTTINGAKRYNYITNFDDNISVGRVLWRVEIYEGFNITSTTGVLPVGTMSIMLTQNVANEHGDGRMVRARKVPMVPAASLGLDGILRVMVRFLAKPKAAMKLMSDEEAMTFNVGDMSGLGEGVMAQQLAVTAELAAERAYNDKMAAIQSSLDASGDKRCKLDLVFRNNKSLHASLPLETRMYYVDRYMQQTGLRVTGMDAPSFAAARMARRSRSRSPA